MAADRHRAVHLIDPRGAGWLACADLAAAFRPGDAVVCIGPRSAAADLELLGVEPAVVIPAPLGAPELAWRPLRRSAAALPPFHAIRAWSAGTLGLAHLAFPGAAVGVPAGLAVSSSPWAVFRRRALAHADRLNARHAEPPHPPALPDRDDLRRAWGLDRTTLAVACLTDPPEAPDARRAAFAVGVLALAGRRIACVLPAGARGVERARRLIERQPVRWPVVLETLPPPLWLHACDAAIFFTDPAGPEPRAVEHARRAGLPTVLADEIAAAATLLDLADRRAAPATAPLAPR